MVWYFSVLLTCSPVHYLQPGSNHTTHTTLPLSAGHCVEFLIIPQPGKYSSFIQSCLNKYSLGFLLSESGLLSLRDRGLSLWTWPQSLADTPVEWHVQRFSDSGEIDPPSFNLLLLSTCLSVCHFHVLFWSLALPRDLHLAFSFVSAHEQRRRCLSLFWRLCYCSVSCRGGSGWRWYQSVNIQEFIHHPLTSQHLPFGQNRCGGSCHPQKKTIWKIFHYNTKIDFSAIGRSGGRKHLCIVLGLLLNPLTPTLSPVLPSC